MSRPSRAKDPAVIALNRVMAAGENDAEYDAAIAELEMCATKTAQGVRVKRNLERSRQAALDQGDRLTSEGSETRDVLANTIDEGLAFLTRAGLRRARSAKPRHPGPRTRPQPLGGGCAAGVQSSQSPSTKFLNFEKVGVANFF